MTRGFRLSVDLSSRASALTCLACQVSHEVDDDDHGVVLAATTVTFLAAHAQCEQPAAA